VENVRPHLTTSQNRPLSYRSKQKDSFCPNRIITGAHVVAAEVYWRRGASDHHGLRPSGNERAPEGGQPRLASAQDRLGDQPVGADARPAHGLAGSVDGS